MTLVQWFRYFHSHPLDDPGRERWRVKAELDKDKFVAPWQDFATMDPNDIRKAVGAPPMTDYEYFEYEFRMKCEQWGGTYASTGEAS